MSDTDTKIGPTAEGDKLQNDAVVTWFKYNTQHRDDAWMT